MCEGKSGLGSRCVQLASMRSLSLAVLVVGSLVTGTVTGQDKQAEVVKKGLAFLAESQADDGTFSRQAGPGLTALAITAGLRNGLTAEEPWVAKGLEALEGFVKPDGGIYGGDRLRNYETCIAVVCFAEANKSGQYDEVLSNADKFLKGLQYGSKGDKDASDPWFGGVGYGGPERPDLSNTAYLVQALRATGNSEDDEAIQRALTFVARCQNLQDRDDSDPVKAAFNDGGFTYVVPTEESGDDGESSDGGLRSYGSMTYSGLKSMIYAGLSKEDKRVKAAIDWIGKHYSVTENPGQGTAGLFYYYNTFATALDVSGVDKLTDEEGTEHDWRGDLVEQLAKTQSDNGSWTNENQRWLEGDPNLSTSFALIALARCKK